MSIQEFSRKIPDSAICVAAMALVQEVSPPFLFNHVLRTFAFAHTIGARGHAEFDTEILFLGCMLHDLGLVRRFINDDRFEIDGADAAADFLSRKGYPDAKIAVIWDAIALHTTLSIPQRKRPEIALVQFGAGIDVGAIPLEALSRSAVDQILEAYPRMGFKEAMLSTMASVVEKKPMTGVINLMGDVGRECVHGLQIPSFCDVVRGSSFEE